MDSPSNQCLRLLQIFTGDENVPGSLVFICLLDALPRDVADRVRLQYGEEMERSKVVSVGKSFLFGSNNEFLDSFSQSIPSNWYREAVF